MHRREVTSFDGISRWLILNERIHERDGFRILSRFHVLIDDADVRFWRRVQQERPNGRFVTLELTSFGREVGGDSPRWWVFSKETDVPALWNDVKVGFLSAQTLLQNARELERLAFTTYSELIESIGRFLDQNERELKSLLDFAQRLATRNELAPAILFSYSVWGSTRRADRSMDGEHCLSDETRQYIAGELALGLRRRGWSALQHAWLEALDHAHAVAPDGGELSITEDDVWRRAEHSIKHGLEEYFTELRDSFRHIDLLCQEARRREYLYADDAFVLKLLDKVSRSVRIVEADLWDLKETLDMWACPPEKREAATVTLAEDVAAFANHRGGLLIVGITNSTRKIVGVPDTENRMKHIASALRSRLDCQSDFLRIRSIVISGVSCIVIVIGQTSEPVGVRQVNDSFTYPLRVGAGIRRVARADVFSSKHHMKGTSFAFAAELAEWVGP